MSEIPEMFFGTVIVTLYQATLKNSAWHIKVKYRNGYFNSK